MRGKAQVELTLRYGEFGEQVKTVAIPISESLTRELMGKVELSDEPFSLMLASPGYGGKGNAVTMRRKAFEMRREVAEDIARAMVPGVAPQGRAPLMHNDQHEGREPACRRSVPLDAPVGRGKD